MSSHMLYVPCKHKCDCTTIMSMIFWDLLWLNKFLFHHKWNYNEVWLLVINWYIKVASEVAEGLKIRIWVYHKISRKISGLHWINAQRLVPPPPPQWNPPQRQQKSPGKTKLRLSRSVLSHTKTKYCPKYSVNDCRPFHKWFKSWFKDFLQVTCKSNRSWLLKYRSPNFVNAITEANVFV